MVDSNSFVNLADHQRKSTLLFIIEFKDSRVVFEVGFEYCVDAHTTTLLSQIKSLSFLTLPSDGGFPESIISCNSAIIVFALSIVSWSIEVLICIIL